MYKSDVYKRDYPYIARIMMSVSSYVVLGFSDTNFVSDMMIRTYLGLRLDDTSDFHDLYTDGNELAQSLLLEFNTHPLQNGFRPSNLYYYSVDLYIHYEDFNGSICDKYTSAVIYHGIGDYELITDMSSNVCLPYLTQLISFVKECNIVHTLRFYCNADILLND
jgi:hypothetical protein